MALITCPECSSEVSSNAATCPKCGNPLGKGTTKKASLGRKIVRTTAAVVVGFVAISMYAGYQESHSSKSSSSSESSTSAEASTGAPAKVEPPIAISAVDLFAQYTANEVLADTKYKGKDLAVQGVVGSISKDVMDNPYITLVAENEYQTVNAYFSKAKIEELSKLHKGDSVTVTCKGNGMSIGSPILDCKG